MFATSNLINRLHYDRFDCSVQRTCVIKYRNAQIKAWRCRPKWHFITHPKYIQDSRIEGNTPPPNKTRNNPSKYIYYQNSGIARSYYGHECTITIFLKISLCVPIFMEFVRTVYSSVDQRKHQSSASLAFVRGIHRSAVNAPGAQMASNAENISIWWRHHDTDRNLGWPNVGSVPTLPSWRWASVGPTNR